jgi:prepilin-type N-terminal cleavage/methylation domain-containing protein
MAGVTYDGVVARSLRDGFTLVEIIVALVVFTTGALGLAAGSAIVAREIATNGLRSDAVRLAGSRQEIVQSACRSAQSGTEARGPLISAWTVSRAESTTIRLTGSVSYSTSRGARARPYALTIECR